MNCRLPVVYLVHHMIHSRTRTEHVVHVFIVPASLTAHGLKAKHPKWSSACQRVNFSHVEIEEYGIQPNEQKTPTVMDWPHPENSKDVRGFLRLTSFYRKFIEHYTHTSHCNAVLHNWHLTRRNRGAGAATWRTEMSLAHLICVRQRIPACFRHKLNGTVQNSDPCSTWPRGQISPASPRLPKCNYLGALPGARSDREGTGWFQL